MNHFPTTTRINVWTVHPILYYTYNIFIKGTSVYSFYVLLYSVYIPYIRKIGGELNWRFVCQSTFATTKLKSANTSYLHILYVWRSLTELPIFQQWRFGPQPPNLIPTNISGYMVDYASLCIHHNFITHLQGVS